MKIVDLSEERKNPEQNPKESVIDFILKYADEDDTYIHTTSVPKVGLNPKSAKRSNQDTPVGVYAYHLKTYKKLLLDAKKNDLRLSFVLPFVGGDNIFILRGNEPYQDTLESYSKSQLETDLQILKSKHGEQLVDDSLAIAHTNENYVNAPIGDIWAVTKAMAIGGTSELSHHQAPDALQWNILLREIGMTTIHDRGYGFIHNFEQSQSLFLTTSTFKVVDHMKSDRKQLIIKIDGNEYKGGRLPTVLNISRIDPTEMANISTKNPTLKKVREVNVRSVRNVSDAKVLTRMFPNATITIEQLEVERIDALEKLGTIEIGTIIFQRFPVMPTEIKALEAIVGNLGTIKYHQETLIRPITRDNYSQEVLRKLDD